MVATAVVMAAAVSDGRGDGITPLPSIFRPPPAPPINGHIRRGASGGRAAQVVRRVRGAKGRRVVHGGSERVPALAAGLYCVDSEGGKAE